SGYNGLAQTDGIIVVAPAAVLQIVSLLRATLIEMARARTTREQRAAIARRLLEYVDSPQFRNSVEEIVHAAADLERMIVEEAKGHQRVWQKRWEQYQRIHWDGSQIQKNLQFVLHSKEPVLVQPKMEPLQLPPSSN
ncbi:MAG: DUF2130 domain-containing protein, partial [Acidobacteria bacterium]|nr:DUF2130 domain-containing protein [Acidobacteriota bacterium]